jgi:hypothetical protein
MPSHISFVDPLGPEWPSCRPILACDEEWTNSVMRRHARAAGGDPPLRRDADHLRHDEAGTAERLPAEVDEVEVGGHAVDGDVHVHR